ncbi:hypothetical protein RGQ29_032295 [Quercus rubra]|uniref:Protein kinase domain-containing protein n=1 Tax=Quercus rubra TaxID=3512 RepID=A0AAN7DVU8_QUERU|nr:hypothetical protein RGQ29_032295 [Quercus rubra]
MKVDLSFPSTPCVSTEAKDLILRLLVKDSSKRLSLQKITEHPWIIKNADPTDPINREVRMTSQGSYLRVSWSSCEPRHPPSLLLQNFPHISQQALEFNIQTMYCPTHSSIIMIVVLNKANRVLIRFIINITHPLT